jgi:hypothetical protein
MKPEKILGLTLVFLGIASLIMGVAIMYVTSAVSGLFSNPLLGSVGAASGLSFALSVMSILGVVEIILGILSLISAVVLFVQKE